MKGSQRSCSPQNSTFHQVEIYSGSEYINALVIMVRYGKNSYNFYILIVHLAISQHFAFFFLLFAHAGECQWNTTRLGTRGLNREWRLNANRLWSSSGPKVFRRPLYSETSGQHNKVFCCKGMDHPFASWTQSHPCRAPLNFNRINMLWKNGWKGGDQQAR